MTILLTLTSAGADTGPFDLYSNIDGFLSAFAVNISKASLLAGYPSSMVPDSTSSVLVKSKGTCKNSQIISIP